MKKLMMMFAAGAALTAAAALPEVRDTASKPLVPKTEFDFSAEVTSPQLWIETADGGRRTVAQAQSGGVLRLAPGETLVMDAALLPPSGTLSVRVRTSAGGGGPLLKFPFGKIMLTTGREARRPVWLTGIPGAETADGRLNGRGEAPDGHWTLLSVGYSPDKVQFHFDGQFAGEGKARLGAPAGTVRIGGKLPLEVRDIACYDVLFDFNDVLKAVSRSPEALAENAKQLGRTPAAFRSAARPRLLASAQDQAELRSAVKQDPAMAALLARYVTRYEAEIAGGVPKEEKAGEIKREDGNRLAMLAILYGATGDKRYVKTASEYIDRIVDYRIWDGDRPYWTNSDLVTGHLLLGLALAYDWMYDELAPELKTRMREVVRFRAGDFARRILYKRWTWANQAMNNHGCVTCTGLMAAAVAFHGDLPETAVWADAAQGWMKNFLANQPADGGDYEGIGYSQYTLGHLLIYADLVRAEFGDDCYRDCGWLAKTMDFRIQSSIPQKHWVIQKMPGGWQRLDHSLISFGDTRQRDFFIPTGPARKLAAEYRRGDYLAFADKVDAIDNFCRAHEYLSLLYLHQARKSGVKPSSAPLPAFAYYPQVGKVLMRSGWDGDEAVMIFRCGTPAGTEALKNFSTAQGDGHVHPDVGAVSLFAAGELMLINSDYCYKLTSQENTLTVNGVGQRGDDRQWLDTTDFYKHKLKPEILRAESHDAYDYTVGDATAAYRPESGLTRFRRHILFLKPDCFVIADELAADRPSTFETRYHSLLPGKASGKSAMFGGRRGELQIRALQPRDGELTYEVADVRLIDRATAPRKTGVVTQRNTVPAKSTLFVTVLYAAPKGGTADFSARIADDVITVRNGRKVRKVKLIRKGGVRLEVAEPGNGAE